MTEVEFEYLLEVVSTEMGPALVKGGFGTAPDQGELQGELFETFPKAANDNTRDWPYLPFPPGWSASC